MAPSSSRRGLAAPAKGAAAGSTRLYPLATLLDQANAWAVRRGQPRLTEATVRQLRKDGLLPPAVRLGGRGQKGGRGPTWAWSCGTYRRLLQVNRLRAMGIRDRHEQRATLFLCGANIDPAIAARDLSRVYAANAKRLTRKSGMEYWRLGAPLPRAVQRDVDHFVDPQLLDKALAQCGSALPPDMADHLKSLLQTPEAKGLVELVMRQAFVPDGDADGPLVKAVEQLPRPVGDALGEDIVEMAKSMVGIWAPTDDENQVVEQLNRLNPLDIEIVRDYTLKWPRLAAALRRLLAAIPNDVEAKRLAELAAAMQRFLTPFTLEARFVLFGLFVARTGISPMFLDAARRVRQLRVVEVLEELARRRLPPNGFPREMEDILAAAGLSQDLWGFWFNR